MLFYAVDKAFLLMIVLAGCCVWSGSQGTFKVQYTLTRLDSRLSYISFAASELVSRK